MANVEANQELSKEVNPPEENHLKNDPIEEFSATTLARLARKREYVLYMGVLNKA